jgi:hypothetical protein
MIWPRRKINLENEGSFLRKFDFQNFLPWYSLLQLYTLAEFDDRDNVDCVNCKVYSKEEIISIKKKDSQFALILINRKIQRNPVALIFTFFQSKNLEQKTSMMFYFFLICRNFLSFFLEKKFLILFSTFISFLAYFPLIKGS